MAALKNYWRRLSAGSAWSSTSSDISTDAMSTFDCDLLFTLQLGATEFEKLTADSLLKADICENKYYANRVLRACHNAGIINPTTGQPDTSKIDRNIVNKLALISVTKQRKLVNLLFYWEEELVRWRLLTQEENEIVDRLQSDSSVSDNERIELKETLKIVQARKRVLPSLRDENGNIQSNTATLPRYEA